MQALRLPLDRVVAPLPAQSIGGIGSGKGQLRSSVELVGLVPVAVPLDERHPEPTVRRIINHVGVAHRNMMPGHTCAARLPFLANLRASALSVACAQ